MSTTMDWKKDYNKKLGSFEDAIKGIKSGDNICSGFVANTPSVEMYEAIRAKVDAGELDQISFYDGLRIKPSFLLDPEALTKYAGHIDYKNCYGAPVPSKAIYRSKTTDFFPCNSTDYALKMSKIIDVFMIAVTPPDKRGYCNIGLTNFFSLDLIRWGRKSGRLRVMIGEINDQMPIVFGDNWVHVSEFDYLVEKSSPIPTGQRAKASAVEEAIGKYVLELIPDGATIQMGWGGITETVVAGLEGKKDLGVLSEMFPAGLNNLVEKGIVTNRLKPHFPGVSVASITLGDKGLYDFITENPAVQIYPSSVTNNLSMVSSHPNMICMNAALQIDLSGQVAAEGLGHTMISGSGGQMEFMMGAAYSDGGKAINLIASTKKAEDGSLVSTLVPELAPGTPVTVPRTYCDYVVTEYGIAQLRYKTRTERAKALIEIAHPDLRGELRAALKKNFYPSISKGK